MAIEASRSELLKKITCIAAIILSKLQPSPTPPLLPVAAADAQPLTQNIDKLELGKFAFTLAATATLDLLFSNKFTAAEAHYFVILGFMAACTAVWNGILFKRVSLQLLGISLILLCFYGLVGSFLPPSFTWACWMFGAFSLLPFLYLVIKLRPIPIPIPIPIPSPATT